MFKFFLSHGVLVLFFLWAGASSAQVKFSETAKENLKSFEAYRSKTCVNHLNPGYKSPNVMPTEQEIILKPEKWDRYVFIGFVGGLNCPLNFSVSYLGKRVEEECANPSFKDSKLCNKIFEAIENPEGDSHFLFVENFDELLGREEYYPWQILESKNGPADKTALTLLQKGNIAIRISISLLGKPVEGSRRDPHAQRLKSRLKKLGLNLIKGDNFYYPAVRFDVLTSGVSADGYYLEISRGISEKGDKVREIPFYERDLKNYQTYSHSVDFFKGAEKDFLEGSHFTIRAFRSSKKKKEPLLEIKISNKDFEVIWKQLLEHYQEVSTIKN